MTNQSDLQNSKTVLLVDDDPLIIRMYQKKLSTDGFVTTTAFNGEEAIASVAQHKPALILLDVMMPKMNGVETLKTLKGDKDTQDIPIIMLTNLGDKSEDIDAAKELGALDYMVKKDVSLADLSARVKSIVGDPGEAKFKSVGSA